MELIMNWFNQGRVMTVEDFDGLMTESQQETDK